MHALAGAPTSPIPSTDPATRFYVEIFAMTETIQDLLYGLACVWAGWGLRAWWWEDRRMNKHAQQG